MKGLAIILGITVYIAFIVWIVWWSRKRIKKKHAESQHKLSDAELFKIMTEANHFITVEQLTTVSSLTPKEAKSRLMYLAMDRIIFRYSDVSGSGKSVYQLKEEVPLISSVRTNLNSLSEQEIIEVILLHVDDYQITVAELVVIFGIDIYEAKALIKRLKTHGMLTVLRKNFKHIYVIKKSVRQKMPKLRQTPKKKNAAKIAIPEQAKIKIPDSEIIQLAIDHEGKLTPTLLCLKKKISIDAAKQQLEELYEQGAFVMDVDKDNYVMEYHLRDKFLF